ncbi:SCAN box domain-containing protein [Nephila pilipes]|uniref:SCAN box domain-containing protein n=1 Tax=Nephila pilipes TaxID=299642 RepID=A0A8X6PMQ6_NEPPI|nr:SCAN box domain-containing protein [Nephila pilipes]
MTRYDVSSDISVFLSIFERQIIRIDIPQDDWVTQLLPLVPLNIVNIVAHEPDPEANDYTHVKKLLLQRFKLSPEQFRLKIFTHKKESFASWRDFAFELQNYFDEWITGCNMLTH